MMMTTDVCLFSEHCKEIQQGEEEESEAEDMTVELEFERLLIIVKFYRNQQYY